jgi:hypothetical protein
MRFLIHAITLLLLCPALLRAQPNVYNDTKGEGKALVEDLLSRMPKENTEVLGLLKIRRPDQEIIEIPVKMTTRLEQDGWSDMYESQPALGHPGEIFIVKHHANKPNEYLLGVKKSATDVPKLNPIPPLYLFQPFAHSDFSYADLGLEFLHWPSQKIVKKEMRKGRSCRVVESINPNPVPGAYRRVLSWIDFETSGIIRAEGYDFNDRLLKEFSIRKVDRDEGRLKEIEIRNEQTDSRTRLEFNFKVEDEH